MYKNKFKNRCEDVLIFLLLFFNTFINLLGGSAVGGYFLYVTILVLFLYFLSGRFSVKSNIVIWVSFLILFFSFLSLFYAKDVGYVLEDLPRVFSNFLALFILSSYVTSYDRLIKFLKINIFCLLFLALINAIFTEWGHREMFWGGVNPVGTMMFFGLLYVGILRILKFKRYIFLVPVFVYTMLITQSQKVILSTILLPILFIGGKILFDGSNNKKIRYILLVLVIFIAAVLGVQNYGANLAEQFQRTAATLQQLVTGENIAGSAFGSGSREILASQGYSFFEEAPFLGYGLNNSRYLFGLTLGEETYTHNTWLELLISFGLFPTLIYFSVVFNILLKTYRQLRITRNSVFLFMLIGVVLLLVVSQFQKMFYDLNFHLFLLLILLYIRFNPKQILNENQAFDYYRRT